MSAPPQFFVQLQHGIQGGFAPPTPSAVHRLTRATDEPNTVGIQSFVRPSGQPEPVESTKSLPVGPDVMSIASDSPKNVDKRVAELISILKDLPTEDPPGSEDIYGENVGIMFGSDELEWANGGPAGCSGGTSSVQATAAQKAKFRRAVEIVEGLVAS